MIKTTGEIPIEIKLKAKRQALIGKLGARPFSTLTPAEKDELLEYLWEKEKNEIATGLRPSQ